jgi:patatin-like phospholipase/acyl hydrolase
MPHRDLTDKTLDGGGVRGLSTLLILKALMAEMNAEREKNGEKPVRPCELFDLIGGTSTGG